MTKKATLLFSNNLITRFMQDADVFESFKVLIQAPVRAEVVDDFGQKNVDAILAAEIQQGAPYSLVAAVTEDFHWFNPRVKVISDGTRWCTLEDYFGLQPLSPESS